MKLQDIFKEKCWFTKTDLNTFGCLEYVYIVQWCHVVPVSFL